MGIFSKKQVEIKQYLLASNASQNIVNGDLRRLCSKPPSVDQSEWIASNVNHFVTKLHVVLRSLTQITPPVKAVSITHIDDKNKKVKCGSFNQYADLVMTEIQGLLDDTDLFPTLHGVEFTDDFFPTVRRIVRNLYDVFAQIYTVHFSTLADLELIAHINTFFLHLSLFAETFDLLTGKDAVLSDLTAALKEHQAAS